MKNSTIHLDIRLDEKNIPEKIEWNATDAEPGNHEATALLLALWDHNQKTGLSIDLWTKDMTIPEMNLFFYQTLATLGETFFRATKNKALSDEINTFAKNFFEKIKEQQ